MSASKASRADVLLEVALQKESMSLPSSAATQASGAVPVPSIEVCHAHVHAVWRATLVWRAGLTIALALHESGFLAAHPGWDRALAGVGIDGKLAEWDDEVAPHARIEVYRPLDFDPMVSRRRRAEHRAREARGPTGRRR